MKRWLATRRAQAWLIAAALLLAAPSLTTGLAGDDYYQALLLRGDAPLAGLPTRRWDLFNFASGDPRSMQALMDAGVYPWATDLHLRLSFFRPLSALTHALDHRLWPSSPWLMHAHCLAWFALTLMLAGALYRRFLGPGWVAGLALLLYAFDDAHGPTLGWIANRNALIALALSLPALLFHDRWRRDGWRPGAWLAPLSVGAGLLAGESAMAICAYLAAYALHLDRAGRRARLASLAPYALIVIAWRVVYSGLGYGTHGSGVYVDPASRPLAFAALLPVRVPALLLGQLAFPWSDFASLYGFVSPRILPVMTVVAVVVLLLLAKVFLPLWRRDATARFFTTGMLLAVLPVCATFPADRLLTFVGLGAMGLIAQFIAAASTGVERKLAVALVVYHAILAPVGLAMRSRSMVTAGVPMAITEATIPKSAEIAQKTVVLVNPPSDLFGAFFLFERVVKEEPYPARLRWLADSTAAVAVTRVEAQTLRVRPERGFFANITEDLARDRRTPVPPRVALAGLTVTISSLTEDGRPAEALFRFDAPLEDASFVWMRWGGAGYVAYQPPPIGASETLAGQDFVSAVGQSARALTENERPNAD